MGAFKIFVSLPSSKGKSIPFISCIHPFRGMAGIITEMRKFEMHPTNRAWNGLGLNLSYDIIKAHAGEIKIKNNEGEGTEFIVLMPFAGEKK
jgi:hypothetical protein